MADDVRLQVRKNNTENEWGDVGNKVGNESIPVTVSNPTADPETGLAKDDTLTDGTQKTQIQETLPDDSTKLNPAITISFNAAGEPVYLDKIIGADTYRKTFTRSDMTVVTTLLISESVKQ